MSHSEFYRRLGALLEEFNVDLVADDDDGPPGLRKSLINVQFNRPYRSDMLQDLSADTCMSMAIMLEE